MPRQAASRRSGETSWLRSSFARRLRVEQLEDRRMLAVFTVNTLDDLVANDGVTSLREAITQANSAAGVDTINFSVNGTIDIASQLPTITGAVTITGPGANLLTIDAGNGTDGIFDTWDGYRIFTINDGTATQIAVEISGLTLTGADTASIGGAINNSENLTGNLSLREAIFLANTFAGADTITFAGALAGGTINISSQLPTITGAVTITGPGANLLTINAGNGTDSTFNTGDGYRIFNLDDGTATQIAVQISGLTLTGGDTSGDGGAIFNNRENLTLTSSTLSGNAARLGGGVHNLVGTATISQSTLSGNAADDGGAVVNDGGTVTITQSTLSVNTASGRGGGVFNFGTATIAQS
jgi:CSLREA domain-containing protein